MDSAECDHNLPFTPDAKPSLGPNRRFNEIIHRQRPAAVEHVLRKVVIDDQDLSKKAQAKLAASTKDSMHTNVGYSLHKQGRWQLLQEPTEFLQSVAGDAPAAIARVTTKKNGRSQGEFFAEQRNADKLVSVRVRGGNGAAIDSLRDSANTEGRSKKKTKEEREMEPVKNPSVLFVMEEVHSDPVQVSKPGSARRRVKAIGAEAEFIPDHVLEQDWSDDDDEEVLVSEATGTNFSLCDFVKSSETKETRKFKTRATRCSSGSEAFDDWERVEHPAAPASPELSEGCYEERLLFKNREAIRFFEEACEKLETLMSADITWVNEQKVMADLGAPYREKTLRLCAILAVELLPNKKHIRLTLNTSFPIEAECLEKMFDRQKLPDLIENIVDQAKKLIFEFFTDKSLAFAVTMAQHESLMASFDPLNDYDLLAALPRSDDPVPAELPSACHGMCSLCNRTCWVHLISTPCGHIFCRRCLRQCLSSCLLSGEFPACPECSCLISTPDVLDVVPLPAVRAMLFASVSRPLECPHCLGVGERPTADDVVCIKCLHCRNAFCIGCRREAHFPLSCSQFTEYLSRFGSFYAESSTMKKGYIRRVGDCVCQDELRVNHGHQLWQQCELEGRSAYWQFAYCRSCLRRFKFTETWGWYRDGRRSTLEEAPYDNPLPKEYQELCYELRKKRIERPDALNPIYSLMEFGTAWLALTKNDKPEHWNAVRKCLTEMRKNLELSSALTTNGQPQLAKAKVEAVQKAALDVIKLYRNGPNA